MNEDFLARDWAENHEKLSDGIDKLIKSVRVTVSWLHHHHFDAPWDRKADQKCG